MTAGVPCFYCGGPTELEWVWEDCAEDDQEPGEWLPWCEPCQTVTIVEEA